MTKKLVLTAVVQSLEVRGLPVRSRFAAMDGETVLHDGVIEINESTNNRKFVPFANLLTFNGYPAFTINNAVLEA